MSDAAQPQPESIKETLISIVIAFTMAFVFRGFVIEAFVIPTGSMAPTLLGAHMSFRGSETGVSWNVNPWDQLPGSNAEYKNPQDGSTLTRNVGPAPGITVYDPISGDPVSKPTAQLFSGDRILVLKYLYNVLDPSRYDVVVFKNPTDPSQNYIKRLIGLPGEQIALVDGDVFTRHRPSGSANAATSAEWDAQGWTIARKPVLQQRATWQTVFDSSEAPLNATPDRTPWTSATPPSVQNQGTFTLEGRTYSFSGGAGEIEFDQTKSRISNSTSRLGPRSQRWTIDDYYPYDESPFLDQSRPLDAQSCWRYPVSDIRVRLGVEPENSAGKQSTPATVTAKLNLRGHEFELSAGAGKAEIRMRDIVGAGGVKGEWKSVASGTCPDLAPGNVTNLEFWHSDQALGVWVEGREVARYEYNWTPAERASFATGVPFSELVASADAQGIVPTLADPQKYVRPEVRLAISGPKCTLYRVGLDRDLHYQPTPIRHITPRAPAHGSSPVRAFVLGADDFFCCGDNSPASLDGRLWTSVDPWVNSEFRADARTPVQEGVVPRELMLGRAFFVYLPSIRYDAKPVPVPDFGRMRFIW